MSKSSDCNERLVPLWRRAVVEARIKLVELNLTAAQRRYLWESIDSRELLIKLVATDYENELEQIDLDTKRELRKTALDSPAR